MTLMHDRLCRDHRMTLRLFFIWIAALLFLGNSPSLESSYGPDTLSVSRAQITNQQALSNSQEQKAQPAKEDENGKGATERLAEASNLFNQGRTALQGGDLGKASDYFQQSLAIHEKLAPFSLEL